MNEIVLLAIIACLSLNLVLNAGVGINEIYHDVDTSFGSSLLRWVSLFVVVFLYWLLWTFVLSPLSLGFFDVIFIFPLCALAFHAIDEYILKRKPATHPHQNSDNISLSIPFCVFSLFMTLRLASSVAGAAILSLFFSAGCILAARILSSIHLRMRSESVGKRVAGVPLAFISNGLLALIFSAVVAILLKQ